MSEPVSGPFSCYPEKEEEKNRRRRKEKKKQKKKNRKKKTVRVLKKNIYKRASTPFGSQ